MLAAVAVLGGCGDDGPADGGSSGGGDAGMHHAPDPAMPVTTVDAAAPNDAGAQPQQPPPDAPEIDPLQCHILCTSNDASGCANAPDHETCFDACMTSIEHCPQLVAPLLDCLGALPKFSCDEDGNVASDVCGPELRAVQACVAAVGG